MNHKNFLCCFTLVLIYSLPLKLQSTTITIDSLSFYSLQTNLISSFNFTSLSFLKLVNELAVISQTGCKDTDFFLSSKFFCTFFAIFLQKISQPIPISLIISNLTKYMALISLITNNLTATPAAKRSRHHITKSCKSKIYAPPELFMQIFQIL